MKKSLFAIAAATAVLAGCQQESFTLQNNAKNDGIFHATIENGETRTILQADGDVYHVAWNGGDQIMVATPDASLTVKYEAYEGGTTAGFMKVNEADTTLTGDPVVAYYPASYFSATSSVPFLPATQGYVAGNVAYNPMYATSSDENLPFKNLCGILKLNVTTTAADTKVKSISFTADQGLSGEFTVVDDAAVVGSTDGLVLNCGEGVAIGTTAVPFYVVVPANTYTNLEITLATTDGKSQTLKMKADKSLTVERAKIYEGDFAFNNLEGAPVLGGLCTLNEGPTVNVAIKSLTDPTATFATGSAVVEITKIVFSPRNPSTIGVEVSDLASECPAYASYDPVSGVVTIASTADKFEVGYNATYLFSYFTGCEEIVGLTDLITENCEDMGYMFSHMLVVKELDLKNFNTDNVTSMRNMFWYCKKATVIDVSNFNTENVMNMWSMFCSCNCVEKLDLSKFNTSNVTNFNYMLSYMDAVTELDCSSFDLSCSTSLTHMFDNNDNMRTLRLGDLCDVSHNPTMSYMFINCANLADVWFPPAFCATTKPTNFWGSTGATDDFKNGEYDRTGNKAGGITIHCTQDTADWLATTGLRWFPNGYKEENGHMPIPVNFVDYTSGMPLTVTWSPN